MLYELKDFLRNNNVTSNLYMLFRTLRHKKRFVTYSDDVILSQHVDDEKYRLNLVVPCFTSSAVFGGIMTALVIFEKILTKLNIDARIIVTGEEHYNKLLTYKVLGFEHNAHTNGIVFLSENRTLDIRKNDLFISTSWKTAYYTNPVINWQYREYALKSRKMIYLIQDFEPGFFPWSTEYILSLSTYKHDEITMAVFNSTELRDYFHKNQLRFTNEYVFKPMLNENLKQILMKNNGKKQKRSKTIIIYGRPVNDRNCFELIHSALCIWSKEYPDAVNWRIISLGDKFKNIKLDNNTIEFQGKKKINDYGELLLTSYAGISLMVSPHPSYPPLEMATFGLKTITNSFETKNLSNFHSNIISLDDITPQNLSHELIRICENYEPESRIEVNQSTYVTGNSLDETIDEIIMEILKREDIIG